jgi:hypothetical protein
LLWCSTQKSLIIEGVEEPPGQSARGPEEPPGQSEFRQPRQDEIRLWGPLVTLHYRVSVPESPEIDADMYNIFRAEHLAAFSEDVSELVVEYLGPGFDAYVSANRGSLELLMTVAVGGGALYRGYKAVGEYPQFREGLIRLISDMERFIESTLRDNVYPTPFREAQITTVGFQLGPSLAAAETYATVAPVARQFRNFLIYISIITTALLICGLILLLTRLI